MVITRSTLLTNYDYSLDTPICSYPFSGTDIGSAILVIGYLDPATEGATITFQCPREYTLIGSNTTTCMGDGEWEPDPREVECRGTLQSERYRSQAPHSLTYL